MEREVMEEEYQALEKQYPVYQKKCFSCGKIEGTGDLVDLVDFNTKEKQLILALMNNWKKTGRGRSLKLFCPKCKSTKEPKQNEKKQKEWLDGDYEDEENESPESVGGDSELDSFYESLPLSPEDEDDDWKEKEEIMPCPFCGSDYTINIHFYENYNQWGIFCGTCGVETLRAESKDVALERWNRRNTESNCPGCGLKT